MQIGDQGRWWNLDIPINRIGAATILLLAIGFAYVYEQPVINMCVWTLVHHSTATLNEVAIKVPWMWEQEETPAGQRVIRLRRARLGEPYSFESIVISDNRLKPVDPRSIAQRFELIAGKLGQLNYHVEPLPTDAFVKAHYYCLAPHLLELPEYRAVCDSSDGNFTVNLTGTDRNVDDFVTVLHNLASSHDAPSSNYER